MKQTVKSNVNSNAILNIIKQSCNIIIPLITYPYVTRTLGENALGKFSFVDSVVSYFIIFAALGVPTYAIREGARIRDDKTSLIKFSSELFSINIVTTVISYLLLLVFFLMQPRLQREPILIFILSINIITNTISRDWINNIYEDFFYITIRYIIFQLISLALIFILVHSSKDYVTYTVIMMFSNSGAYISSFIYTLKRIPVRFTIRLNLTKHLKPILLLFCSTLAIQIYVKSDITVLGYLRSDSEVGIYTAASKIYTIIKALLNAVIMVAIPRLSYYLGSNCKEKYNDLVKKLRDSLIALIIPCVVGVFCLSKEIIYLIGGKTYISGCMPLSILCFALFFSVMGCYYAQGILIANRDEKTFMIATMISAVINIVFNIIVIPFWGMNGAAVTTVIAEVLIYVICGRKSSKYYKRTKISGLISIISGCFAIIIVCVLSRILVDNILIRSMISIFISAVIYFLILVLGKNSAVLNITNVIRNKIMK